MADDKTEKPTQKKLSKARKDGNIARTQEIGQWASLFVLTLVIGPVLAHEATRLQEVMKGSLQAIANPDPKIAVHLLRSSALGTLVSLVALGTGVMVVGVVAAVAQGGMNFSTKAIKPNFNKLNPLKGLKRLFGLETLWQGAKTLLKSALLALVAYSAIRSIMPIIGGGLMPMSEVLEVLHDHAISLMRTVAEIGLLLGAIDYVVTRRRRLKGLKMSKQEVKDEYKQAEGDPKMKGAIRSRQLSTARARMFNDAAEADVLLVNPTHVAIALKYDPDRGAPRVVARGAGAIAARLRLVAHDSGVPMVHDIPLARALYRSCEVGQEIPRELFAAVASVLAFVISRRSRGEAGGSHETPRVVEEELPYVPRAAQRRRTRPPRPAGSGDAGASGGSDIGR